MRTARTAKPKTKTEPAPPTVILIISDVVDVQVLCVTPHLVDLGRTFARFNVTEFPQHIKHTSIWTGESHEQRLVLPGGEAIDCSEIKAIWYRKPTEPQIDDDIDEWQREYAYDETRNDLEGLYGYLADRYWISPIHRIRRAANKPMQLRLAQRLGFRVPRTIVTNDPETARAFFREHEGRIIYKTISGGAIYTRTSRWAQKDIHRAVYTTPLLDRSEDDFAAVEFCPCLFQELIVKKFELRVTVVGDRVFAAEIHSQVREETKDDWRRKADGHELPHRIHDLPEIEADRCRHLVRELGLQFGGIDMIYTPDGEYVFLEINPNGQYGWIERETGLPINRAIAEALAAADAAP